LHPHTAFMTGFLRVLANPVVLLFWIALSATLVSQEWIADQWSRKLVCVAGVGVGGITWFVILSFLVSLGHGRFSAISLVRLSRLSGLLLLIAAFFIGVRLVQLIARKT
jgi:threonine/homoserine/homoserine lactone efflux protein